MNFSFDDFLTLLSGTGKLIMRGGAKGATTVADLTSTAQGADHQGLDTYDPSTASLDTKMPAQERSATGTLGALGSVALACPGAGAALVHIGAGLVGTLVPEYLSSDGTTWETGVFKQPLTGADSSSLVNPAAGSYYIAPSGTAPQVRVRCSAYTSGSTIVFIDATRAPPHFTPSESTSAAADGESNATPLRRLIARLEAYNGTGWDRAASGLANFATYIMATPTGVQQSMPVKRFVATRPALADTNFTHGMVNARGDDSVAEQYAPQAENNSEGGVFAPPLPLASNVNALTQVDSAALENSHVLKAAAGRLYGFDGHHEQITRSASINTATLNLANTVTLAPVQGMISVVITGLTGTGATVTFELFDGQTWTAAALNVPGGGTATTATADGTWNYLIALGPGMKFRVRVSTVGTGTATIVVGGPIQLWLQIFNTASVPADATVPAITVPLAPFEAVAAKLSPVFDTYGRYFATGISWALSETAATKTIATGTGGWFNGAVK